MFKSSILLKTAVTLCFGVPCVALGQNPSGATLGGIPFQYSLSTNAKTSAGVFKPDSTLVRTLWSGERRAVGLNTASWDGKNDGGVLMPDGPYHIKVLSNNVTYDWQGVIGNTSDSLTGKSVHSAHQMISSMAQVGNAMYYAVGYTEVSDVHYRFITTKPNQVATSLHGGGMFTRYVASDNEKVYYAGQVTTLQNGNYKLFYAITVMSANPAGQDVLATFSSGQPHTMGSGSSFVYSIIDKTPQANQFDTAGIYGLTVQKTGSYLFAAHRYESLLKVFDKTTGAFVNSIPLNAVRQVVVQGDNVLWAITGTNTVAKYTVNSNGTLTAANLTLSGLTEPLALTVSPDGTKVAVADRGISAHQVKIYNTANGTLIQTIGRNENYTNPAVYDNKFYFNNTRRFDDTDHGSTQCFLQYQSDGSIWIGDYGNMRCQHFSSTGAYIDNIQYMGYSYSSQVDINNSTRVFSDYLEFKVDYSKSLDNGKNGSWKFVRNWSKNVATPVEYDEDKMRSVITLSNGKTYALYNIPGSLNREVIELDTVIGIRHTGITVDNRNCDINPDGSQWQIGNNTLGQPTFWKRKPLNGFDGNHNPVWGSYTTLEATPAITANDPVTADGLLRRSHQTTTGIIASFNSDNAGSGRAAGYHLGGFKGGRWVFKTSLATHVSYNGAYPDDGAYDIGNDVRNPGSFMQVVDRNIFWGYKGEFWKGSQVNKYNHYYDNGLFLGQFGVSGDVARESGIKAYPGIAGNANTGTYVKVGSDIYFYHCDEGQHAGVHRWKISGVNTIQEQSISINKSGTPPPSIHDYSDLMVGLPYDDTLGNNTAGWTRFAPESGSFQVRTSFGTYKKSENDLRIFSIGQNVDCWVKRDLGNNTGLVNWKITGDLSYPQAGEFGDNFMEVLDANERVIVRISRPEVYPNLEIKANASRLAFGNIYTHVGQLRPLSIVANASTVTINYSDFNPVTVAPFDPQSDITNPTTLRFYTVSQPSGHQINIARLKFYKDIGVGPGHFRSKGTGLWKNNSSWQTSQDSTNWVDANKIPDMNAKSIAIHNGHVITLTDTAYVDQLTIQGSSGFRVAPNALLLVNDGIGDDIVIAGSANMLIQSNATGTGRIGNSTGTISGNVTVERYITSLGSKAYRLLAPTTNTANGPKPYIRNNWQEGQNNMGITGNSNNTPGYGMHITGSMMGANGFDATLTGTASLLYFNQTAANPNWQAVPNTNATSFDVKKGYLVYIRGDRSTDLHGNSTTTNTTLRTTGTIATGTQNFPAQEGNGRSSLVTNPYPCPVNWSAVYNDPAADNASKFERYYTYWDPNIGMSGGFVTVFADGTKSAATNASTDIQPGQAFFIKAKPGAPSSTFVMKEAYKSNSANQSIFRTGAREQFRASLYFNDADANRILADGVTAVFDTAYSMAADGNDAEEMANWDENVAIKRWDKMISIEARPLIEIRDTMQLSVQRLRMQSYEWQFDPTNFSHPGLWAYLEDKYTNVRTQISLTAPSTVAFTVNVAPGSSASDRFRVIFTTNSSLPVTLLSLKAYQKGTGNQVEWKTANETNIDKFEVEKSTDGRNFMKVGTVQPRTGSNGSSTYSLLDGQPVPGNNYYRIKTVDKNGAVSYSAIVNVKTGSQTEKFEIYPNPFEGSYVTVQFNNVVKGTYTIELINTIGQKVVSKIVNHAGGSAGQSIRIENNLPPGGYTLQITGKDFTFSKQLIR